MPFYDDLVEVDGVEGLEGEVVNDEPVNRDQPAQLDLAGLVEAGRL